VILSKDPLRDIHIVEDRKNVVTVIKDGKIVKDIRKTGEEVSEKKEEIEIQ
jgi:imidazolonepropionase-like amidohydrolase